MREQVKIRKQNMRIYSLYRMMSVDHLFFYAIDFLFLSQVKNISASDIVLGQAFFAFFVILFQMFAVMIIDKIGHRNSIVLSNLIIALHVVAIMNCTDVRILILAQFIDAIGFSIKDSADTSLLNRSIPQTTKKGEIFSQIEGRGRKNYYYFSAISAIVASVLYIVNEYIPLIISLIISVLSAIIALGFREVKIEEKEEKKQAKIYFCELRDTLKFIVKSKRLKSLLLCSGVITGIYFVMNSYIISLLEEIEIVAYLIAISTFFKSVASGIGSKKQLSFHNKFRNKSLSMILIGILISIILIGIFGKLDYNKNLLFIMITIAALIIFFMKGVYDVLIVRYLQNFTNEKILPKIYALNSLTTNLCRVVISLIGSYYLRITNTSNAVILLGVTFLIIVVFIISYMKKRVGLRPEQYEESEINLE